MENAEIVIIGGGVVGASVAWHLAERGATDVLVIEREQTLGMGSTGAATGGVRAQFETDVNINMSVYSLEFFRTWDVDCGYEPRGYLFFATRPEHLDFLRKNVEKQRSLGVKGVELVGTEDIRRLVPGMNCDDILGGSFGAADGFIEPLRVMNGFMDGAIQRGARLSLGTAVHSISTDQDKVIGVKTDRGSIACEKVVLCAGAWARELAATAGLDLPVEPMRRQIVWARSAEPLPTQLPMVIDLGTGFHFRPAKNSNHELMFAYPDPDEKPTFNLELDDSFVEEIRLRAHERASWLYETEVIREKCRVGLYENTPDHHAILGRCEVEGLFFANGFSGHGVMHAPATGRALAETILDGHASFLDLTQLAFERFENGALLHETAFI
ncbi:MAG TPA: FAD-dependent oxidoreductase [Pyrinomonadaceae bacterium]|nr:FAD-dependent oxidoreductase [Pyrinomonadaceae bacterium]HMP65225.1 FAD-dependent oxidoreductase [Pyrinomonadaceae bacterium]